jgi:hypothetical protein
MSAVAELLQLRQLLQAERVKLRKSWPLLTAILAPICLAGFLGVMVWFSGTRMHAFRPGFRFWLEVNYVAWNLILMPITAALIGDLSWQQERDARAWNLLLLQPQSRHAHYLVKVFSHLALLLLAEVLLAVLLTAGGYLLRINPQLEMGPLPLAILLRFAAYSALATVAVAAFQTWLSMRIPGLWVALAAALLGSWMVAHGPSPLLQLLPWGLSGQMGLVFERWRVLPWPHVPGNLLAAAALVAVGALDFVRHPGIRT